MRKREELEEDILGSCLALERMSRGARTAKSVRSSLRDLCAEYVELHDMATRETLPPTPIAAVERPYKLPGEPGYTTCRTPAGFGDLCGGCDECVRDQAEHDPSPPDYDINKEDLAD